MIKVDRDSHRALWSFVHSGMTTSRESGVSRGLVSSDPAAPFGPRTRAKASALSVKRRCLLLLRLLWAFWSNCRAATPFTAAAFRRAPRNGPPPACCARSGSARALCDTNRADEGGMGGCRLPLYCLARRAAGNEESCRFANAKSNGDGSSQSHHPAFPRPDHASGRPLSAQQTIQ